MKQSGNFTAAANKRHYSQERMVTLALLQIKNFSFSYPRSAQPALQGINISVEKGSLSNYRPTGAGKAP